jgi:hypothetical protein
MVQRALKPARAKAVLAHELFHVGQAYHSNACKHPLWLSESTAEWFMDFVYGQEVQEEHGFAPAYLSTIEKPLFQEDPPARPYGAYLLWQYVTRTANSPAAVRQAFDNLAAFPNQTAAVDGAIGGFGNRWAEFALFAYNDDPVAKFLGWDRMGHQPFIAPFTPTQDNTEIPLTDTMHPLSARYYVFDLAGTKAQKVELVGLPPRPLSVQVIPLLNSRWETPLKVTADKAWCRSKDKLGAFVLIVSNDQPNIEPFSLRQFGTKVKLSPDCEDAAATGQLVIEHTGQRDQGTADDTQYQERIVVDARFTRSRKGEWTDAGTTATYSGGDQGVRHGGGCDQFFTAVYSGSAPPFSQLSLDVFGDQVAVFTAAFEGRRDETFDSTGAGCGEDGTSSSEWSALASCGEGVVTKDEQGRRTITFNYRTSFTNDNDGATETCKGTIVEEPPG